MSCNEIIKYFVSLVQQSGKGRMRKKFANTMSLTQHQPLQMELGIYN
jgi:hypothetical protein